MNFNFRNKPLWKMNQNAGAAVDDRQSLKSSRDRLTEPSQEPLSPKLSDKARMSLSEERLDAFLSHARLRLNRIYSGAFMCFFGVALAPLTLSIIDANLALISPLKPSLLMAGAWLGLCSIGISTSVCASLKWEGLIKRLEPLNLDGESERSDTLHLIKTSKSARLLARQAQDQGRVLRAFDLEMMKEAQKQEQSERTGRELQRRLRAP